MSSASAIRMGKPDIDEEDTSALDSYNRRVGEILGLATASNPSTWQRCPKCDQPFGPSVLPVHVRHCRKRRRRCPICKAKGHTRRRCPERHTAHAEGGSR